MSAAIDVEFGENGEKITFDYLLQKVVENTMALTNPPTIETSVMVDEEPDLPLYKVTTVGVDKRVTIHQ